MIPSKMPADLSADAQALLRECYRDGGYLQINDDQRPAAIEIAQAYLGSVRLSEKYSDMLYATPLAKEFTVADGSSHPARHGLYAEVELIEHTQTTGDGILLACLLGARFTQMDPSRNLPWARWRLEVRHPTATDAEHDRSILADLRIDNPMPSRFSDHATVMVGVLTEARLYPIGTDITLLDEHRPEDVLTEPEMCEWDQCTDAGGVHPFAPYIPKQRPEVDAYLGRPVRITLRALDSVTPRGLPRGTVTTVSADGD